MPACGLFIIDEAIAAAPIAVLVAGVGDVDVGDRAVDTMIAGDVEPEVATICAMFEEVEVVMVAMLFMPGMLAISIFAVAPFQLLDRRNELDAEWYVCLKKPF